MSVYLIPIGTALLTFPLLTALITIPYIIVQYHKYGSISPTRIVVIYSFIFYLLCAYFLVVMPLPPIEEVAQYTKPIMQLIPLQSLRELSVSTSLVWNDPSTYWTALNEPSLFLIVFNVFLTIPFGMYLRYYFRCSWKKTLCYSFALTMSFELLQLSALLGVYPRPYRLFDVDDLLTNTLGGMIGYLLTPVAAHFLPSRAAMDEAAYHKGKNVSLLRRAMAFFIDLFLIMTWSVVILIIIAVMNGSYDVPMLQHTVLPAYACTFVALMWIIPILLKGQTIGKAIVKITLVKEDGQCPKWYEISIHFSALFLLILPSPYYIFLCVVQAMNATPPQLYVLVFLILAITVCYLISVYQGTKNLFMKKQYPWYDSKSKISNKSTISVHIQKRTKKEEPDNTPDSSHDIEV